MAAFTDYGNFDALGLAELIGAKDVSAEEVLEALPEQARKAGAPPGWIRLRELGPASRR